MNVAIPVTSLLHGHQSQLRSICRSLCGPGEDVEDVLQDTNVEIIRHLHGFRGDSSFLTWATAVARSQLHRHRRRHRRYDVRDGAIEHASKSYPELAGLAELAPDDETARNELRGVLAAALDGLSDLDRQVFVLREVEGMTAPEAAEALGLSISAVKSRLHRARAALRTTLATDPRVASFSRPSGSND